MLNHEGKYSDSFMLWCRKTEHLTDDQWSYAFESLEREIVKNKQAGDQSWPPSYAEFAAMANKKTSPNGNNSSAYLLFSDPGHPSYVPPKAVESDSYKQRKLKIGNTGISNTKNLFNDKE